MAKKKIVLAYLLFDLQGALHSIYIPYHQFLQWAKDLCKNVLRYI